MDGNSKCWFHGLSLLSFIWWGSFRFLVDLWFRVMSSSGIYIFARQAEQEGVEALSFCLSVHSHFDGFCLDETGLVHHDRIGHEVECIFWWWFPLEPAWWHSFSSLFILMKTIKTITTTTFWCMMSAIRVSEQNTFVFVKYPIFESKAYFFRFYFVSEREGDVAGGAYGERVCLSIFVCVCAPTADSQCAQIDSRWFPFWWNDWMIQCRVQYLLWFAICGLMAWWHSLSKSTIHSLSDFPWKHPTTRHLSDSPNIAVLTIYHRRSNLTQILCFCLCRDVMTTRATRMGIGSNDTQRGRNGKWMNEWMNEWMPWQAISTWILEHKLKVHSLWIDRLRCL